VASKRHGSQQYGQWRCGNEKNATIKGISQPAAKRKYQRQNNSYRKQKRSKRQSMTAAANGVGQRNSCSQRQ